MDKAMDNYIQCVDIEGTLYVGGGWTECGEGIVMAYKPVLNKWHQLPQYNAKDFAMAGINENLVLVGGRNECVISDLGVWHADTREWESPSHFPAMPTPRFSPSSVTYKEWLIIAGGITSNDCELSTVEVLDVTSRQWYSGPSTPLPWHSMKSAVLGDTWYVFGGRSNWSPSFYVHSTSLSELVSYSTTKRTLWTWLFSRNPWRRNGSIEYYNSCPLAIGQFLLSVGGMNLKNEPVPTIQYYNPAANTWALAGKLPRGVHNCAATMLLGKIYMMGGHDGTMATNLMYRTDFL